MPTPRSKSLDPTRLFQAVDLPICVIGVGNYLAYVNPAFEQWCRCSADELLGLACQHHAPIDATRAQLIAAALVPPAQTIEGETTRSLVAYPTSDGQVAQRHATFLPLGAADGAEPLVLVALSSRDAPASEPADPTNASDDWHAELVQFRARYANRSRLDLTAGPSPFARRLRAQLEIAQANAAHVVVFGPSGSGRRSTARAIHRGRAPHEAAPLTTLDGALATGELVAAALASATRASNAAGASSCGALLITEADRLSREAQGELWRALRSATTAPRILSTATRSLVEAAHHEEFQPDLAHALSTFEIKLVSLVERRPDIPLLAQALLEELNGQGGREHTGFSPEAVDLLVAYRWPGHVTELVEIVRRAHQQSEGPVITSRDLDDRVRLGDTARRREPEPIVLDQFMTEIEKEVIARALKLAKGNKARAARLLGLTRPRLYRRMEQLGLEDTSPEA